MLSPAVHLRYRALSRTIAECSTVIPAPVSADIAADRLPKNKNGKNKAYQLYTLFATSRNPNSNILPAY